VRSYQFLIQFRSCSRIMESDGSLPSSQQPATCPCHRQDQSGTRPLIHLRSIVISFHRCRDLSSGLFPSGIFTKPSQSLLPRTFIMALQSYGTEVTKQSNAAAFLGSVRICVSPQYDQQLSLGQHFLDPLISAKKPFRR
jgi:hypothetical protein